MYFNIFIITVVVSKINYSYEDHVILATQSCFHFEGGSNVFNPVTISPMRKHRPSTKCEVDMLIYEVDISLNCTESKARLHLLYYFKTDEILG